MWGVATLFVLAIGLPIAAFQVIFGIAGTAIGWILFLVIGNPASGGSSAPELLPGFWRALSQLLPPGAGVTSLRDVVYFNGHGSAHALIVLAVYAAVGASVALIAYKLRIRAGAAATADYAPQMFRDGAQTPPARRPGLSHLTARTHGTRSPLDTYGVENRRHLTGTSPASK